MILIIFIFGLVIGSFLNSVIFRMQAGEQFVWERSRCLKCSTILKIIDLIPILSFFITKGKCRYCGHSISWQYPFVELSAGILFVLYFLKFETVFFSASLLSLILYSSFVLLLLSCLIVIFVYDLRTSYIPDAVVYLGVAVSIIYLLTNFSLITPFYLLGIAIPFVLFGSLVLISKEKWMGWGDVKLGVFMGLILGFPGIVVALYIAFITGAIVAILLLAANQKTIKSEIAFGPFLVGATVITMLYGNTIIEKVSRYFIF